INPAALDVDFLPLSTQRYTKEQDLLNDPEIDLVVLCTPSGLHAQQAIAAAKVHKHVLTEKPMATRWEDGLEMVAACEKAQVQLFVVKQNRYNPTVQKIKHALHAGYFGRIYLVHSNVFWTRPQSYYDQSPWRGTWALDGGALMNQASHYVDLMQYLIGSVSDVQAMTATLARKIEAEDTAVVNLRYQSGALGAMSVTMLTYPKNLEGSITIIGEKGTVRLGGVALNEITHWEFQDCPVTLKEAQTANYQIASVYGQGHVAYYQNVIDNLHGIAPAEVDGRAGLQSLELLIAIYRATQQGNTVHLPLQETQS
ncbi:MAG TPA: Gfo/Idh/MocA family oxidoreductase, partial [Gammaproteobacteria bacterium]|nr:Gfo/Idh/MocA family oxidoreductase [Gammaproteobacteria bacterium]